MAKKQAARRGRPRQFGEREVITLAMPVELLGWLDAAAAEAGVSRTRLAVELLGLARLLRGEGFVRADAEGTHFTSTPDPDAFRRAVARGLAEGEPVPALRLHVRCDEVVAGGGAGETARRPKPPARGKTIRPPKRGGR